ncbi:uncharacterized protein [Agelaius tricolor]|uniref:uncharacterized protein isoform X2 n=1 Tax=Agelaius tricolor TaxID=9191 RepID=UPI0039F25A09
MGFVDGHKTSGALKLSCNSLSFVLTFFSDSDGLNVCQRAPSRVRGFPRAGEAPFVSAAEVYMVTLLQHCSLSFFLGSKCGYQQSRQSTRSAIRVAFGSCPGVVVSPVATASVSECARSVRPKQLSVLKRRLSKRHQPGASRTFPADEVQMHCIHGRAPHPGKYSRISAVKFKRAICSEHAKLPSPTGRQTGFAALASPAFRAAVRNRRGVAAHPTTMASASERGRSVRPEEPGLLRSRLSKRQRPGASRTFPADKAAFLRT